MDKKIKKVSIIILIIYCIINLILVGYADDSNHEIKKILFINSYHEGYKWSDDIFDAFRAQLIISDYNIQIDAEYMDTKRIADEEYLNKLIDTYQYRFSDSEYDLIACSDNAAFDFLSNYGDNLFLDTPIVFCGVNDFQEGIISNHEMMTGVVEGFDVEKTIQVAIEQNPGLKNIYYINDTTTTGAAIQNEFDNAVSAYKDDLNVIRLTGHNLDEISAKAAALPDESVLLFLVYFRDNEGNVFNYYESLEQISLNTNVPIYGIWDFHLGHGIIGGALTSGYKQGERIAEISLRILNGEAPGAIQVQTKVENNIYFDYEQLKKYKIPLESVPKESLIINHNGTQKKKILILNSYSKGTKWTSDIEEGIKEALISIEDEIEYYYEYMDVKRYVEPVEQYYIKDFLLRKYSDENFDIVIVTDDQAYQFVSDYSKVLFKNTPIVFCGVGNVDDTSRDERIIGITEDVQISDTIEIALDLHPKTERIIVVNDTTLTGKNNKKNLEDIMCNFTDIVTFEVWDNVNMSSLQEQVTNLNHNDIILFLTFNRDKSYNNFSHEESIRMIAEQSTVPIYGLWEFYLGEGLTGGKLMSGHSQGNSAGQIVLSLLNGQQVGEISIPENDTSAYMFDYNKLNEYGVKLSALPKESLVINKPITLIEYMNNNKLLFICIGASILVIIVLLIFVYLLARNNKMKGIVLEYVNRFRVFFEQSPVGILNLSFEGKVIDTNRRLSEIIGYSINELLNKNIVDIILNDDIKIYEEALEKLRSNTTFIEKFEIRCIKKDQSILYVNVSISIICNHEDNPLYINGIFEDITQIKEVQREKESLEMVIRNQQKLESIGTLASGVAHEINNPINGILNYGQIIYDDQQISEDIRCFANEIINESNRISIIVKNLLQFSRHEVLEYSFVNILEIVNETLLLVNTIMKHDQIIIHNYVDDDLPLVSCRRQQVQQILMNLITNSKDALNLKYKGYNESKKIEIDAMKVFHNNKNCIRISVKDYGTGIKATIQKNIYDPFFTTKGRHEGTGLGLSISYGIAKEHGGELLFDTKEGEHTLFYLYLPISQ